MATVSYTTEELKKMKSETDWERVLAMTDDEIPRDEDSPTLSALRDAGKDVRVARRGRPFAAEPKEKITIRVEASALRALRATGKGWQTRLSNQISKWATTVK
jgi:uncharacterized protein (DUF4415 family)